MHTKSLIVLSTLAVALAAPQPEVEAFPRIRVNPRSPSYLVPPKVRVNPRAVPKIQVNPRNVPKVKINPRSPEESVALPKIRVNPRAKIRVNPRSPSYLVPPKNADQKLEARQPPRVPTPPSLPIDYQVQTNTFGRAKFLDVLGKRDEEKRDIEVIGWNVEKREEIEVGTDAHIPRLPDRKRSESRLAKRAFVCSPTDDDASVLDTARSRQSEGVCIYPSSGQCEYFPENGTFSAGASNCPSGMVEGVAAPPPPPATTPPTPPPATTPAQTTPPAQTPPAATTPPVTPPAPTTPPITPTTNLPAPSTPARPTTSAAPGAGAGNSAMGMRVSGNVVGLVALVVGMVWIM